MSSKLSINEGYFPPCHGITVSRWSDIYHNRCEAPLPAPPSWVPKNPEIKWPSMEKERPLSKEEWGKTGFPFFDLSPEIVGQVNVPVWSKKIDDMKSESSPSVSPGLVNIMEDIELQLLHGATSHVGPPGVSKTYSKNFLKNPSTQIPKVVDALASFVKKGHLAGPFHNLDKSKFKINQIMVADKPNGDVRVCGNLSSPSGSSFNEGIPDSYKERWPVTMMNAKQFAKMICDAGLNAHMACSDLKDAYKMIPVCLEQRYLQAYEFCGALFIETKLIFGDKLSCQYFDRFHHAILHGFVYPSCGFPVICQGRTVDDIPTVVPDTPVAINSLLSFVKSYREELASLNIEAAPDDPTRTKAFDCSTYGEVLGIRFCTKSFTWSIPSQKSQRLIEGIMDLVNSQEPYCLREMDVVMGRLNYLALFFPPLKTLIADAMLAKGENAKKIVGLEGSFSKNIDLKLFTMSDDVATDFKMIAAILIDARENPLPIINPEPVPPLHAIPAFTDASGKIDGPTSPCLGIFLSSYNHEPSEAHSIPFPTDFLLFPNGSGLVADTTTTLEALGILMVLLVNPSKCVGKSINLHIDNYAVVLAFKKRRSRDPLAHCIIRASYLVAGAIRCRLFVTWSRRRSCPRTCIADDLTHNDFKSTLLYDQNAVVSNWQHFPHPLKVWMWRPYYDRDLGHRILDWLRDC